MALLLGLLGLGDGVMHSLVDSHTLGSGRRALVGDLAALLIVNHLLELHDISGALSLGSDNRLSNGDGIGNGLGNRGNSDGSESDENGRELHCE